MAACDHFTSSTGALECSVAFWETDSSIAQVLVLEREQVEALVDREPRAMYRQMGTIVRAAHRVQARQWMQASELGDHISKQRERY